MLENFCTSRVYPNCNSSPNLEIMNYNTSNTSGMNNSRPREGSRIRIIGLKNPDLNDKVGTISSYTLDGERVMVTLNDGTQRLVKVKPKQIELLADADDNRSRASNGGPRRGGLHRRSSRRSQDSRGRGRPRANGGMNGRHNQSYVSGAGGGRSVATNGSQEVMETLRSADAMFDLADTSGDGLISQDEFEYYMKKHTNHDINMIRECFFMIDVDGNGDITRDEVRNEFLTKRRQVKGGGGGGSVKAGDFEKELLQVSRDADALFDRADADGSGSLSIREFELFMKRNTSHSDAAIHELFDSMDVDKDGYITREEVRKAYLHKAKTEGNGGGKKTLMDILGLKDDDMAELEDDVYNMFFLADTCSQGFWFAIMVWILKLSLILIIALDLFDTGDFPDQSTEVSGLVKTTQFLLMPVNVAVQEELITTFYLYANLKWSKHILELSPGASKWKYHGANMMRFLDGLAFLFINTTLLLQATQVLGAFLNFAALQFLSSIDNVALHLARDGYLTESLENVAQDVLLMRLPKNHNDCMQKMDSAMLAVTYFIMIIAWVLSISGSFQGLNSEVFR